MKLFLIEDDVVLRTELAKLLEGYGYICAQSDDFEHIVRHALDAQADLILLDINLPYMDGYSVCREIRRVSQVPIVMLTSRNTDMDELMGMNLGADDFIAKPFHPQILLARIGAILKRAERRPGDTLTRAGLTLSLVRGTVSFDGKTEELTKNEMQILAALLRNAGRIVSRDELMNELWQSDVFIDDNTLTVNVGRLRHRLNAIGASGMIVTKRGRGYCI